jgi:hypothetical protein
MTDMFVVLLDEKLKSDLQGELRALRRRGKKGRRRLNEREMLNFEYLMGRTADLRTIEGRELKRLIIGNDAIIQARRHLYHGRGNGKAEVEASKNENAIRSDVARDLYWELLGEARWANVEEIAAADVAAALEMRAGSCTEFAALATAYAGVELSRGETTHLIEGKEEDHTWSELRVNGCDPGADDVIMDPWADGMAVLRQDSAFGFDTTGIVSSHHLDRRAAKRVMGRALELLQRLGEPDMQKKKNDFWAGYKAKNYTYGGLRDPTPVIGAHFLRTVDERLRSLGSQPAGRVLQQIVAAGAARQLGRNVKQAAQEAHRRFPPEQHS